MSRHRAVKGKPTVQAPLTAAVSSWCLMTKRSVKKMKIKGLLGYEKQVDRYVIYGDDGRRSELHCGDYFEAKIGPHWIGTTIEMQWYDDGRHKYFLTQGGLGLAELIEASVPVRQTE